MNKRSQKFFKESVAKFADALYKKLNEEEYTYTLNLDTADFEDELTTTGYNRFSRFNQDSNTEDIHAKYYCRVGSRASDKKRRIRIFGEDWPLLEYYRNNVLVNGKPVYINQLGFTGNAFSEGVYDVIIKGNPNRKITTCSCMFGRTDILEIELFDTSNVTDMSNMFRSCAFLKTVPKFDTSNIVTMKEMFSRCDEIQSVPEFDTHNVLNFEEMFSYCDKLVSVPRFKLNPKVITCNDMFVGCENLNAKTRKIWGLTQLGGGYSDTPWDLKRS